MEGIRRGEGEREEVGGKERVRKERMGGRTRSKNARGRWGGRREEREVKGREG